MEFFNRTRIDRRDFLRFAGLGAASLFSRGFPSVLPKPRQEPNLYLKLQANRTDYPIFPGTPTNIYRFTTEVVTGDPARVQPIPGSYLGPTIRMRKGETFGCRLLNGADEPTIVHFHGLNTPQEMDGHPRYAIQPGASYDYQFPIINRAGTYWYHAHPDMRTGQQIYRGLAGAFIVHDDEESALSLPRGEYDIPLIIQDKLVDDYNQFSYTGDPFFGMIGDRPFVNGKPDYILSAATRVYRLRLINGSNARVYRLAWSNLTPMTVIGTDGGLLAKPVLKPFVMLAPGERVEIWLDLRHYPIGTVLTLKSLQVYGLQAGFGGGTGVQNGSPLNVMKIRVERAETETLTLPSLLAPFRRYTLADAVNASNPRSFAITFDGMFLVNGARFDLYEVAENENVQNNTVEIWEFVNQAGNLLMVHPMHLHAASFQIYQRSVLPGRLAAFNSIKPGLTDEGWKDTIMLLPGERSKFFVKLGPYPGTFLYHCHNLEHEDMGMMRNYRVH